MDFVQHVNNNAKIQSAARDGDKNMVEELLNSGLPEKDGIELWAIKNALKWAKAQNYHEIEDLLSEKIAELSQ